MGWLFDADGTKIRRDKKNASDLSLEPFCLCGSLSLYVRRTAVIQEAAFGNSCRHSGRSASTSSCRRPTAYTAPRPDQVLGLLQNILGEGPSRCTTCRCCNANLAARLQGVVLPILALYAYGGLPCVLWGFFARAAWRSGMSLSEVKPGLVQAEASLYR